MGVKKQFSIIGPGRVGQALGRALVARGYPIIDVKGRDQRRVQAAVEFIGAGWPRTDWDHVSSRWDVLFITVTDDALADVTQWVSHRFEELHGKYVYHTSGFHPSTVLRPLKALGAHTGSIHPLMTFSDPTRALDRLSGIYYALEGDEPALSLAQRLVAELGGRWFLLSSAQKPVYHAAAVLACGHLMTLLEAVFGLLSGLGDDSIPIRKAFGRLIQESVEQAVQVGGRAALTGPFARADVKVIETHLQVLGELNDEMMALELYKSVGRWSLKLAELDETVKASIEELLK